MSWKQLEGDPPTIRSRAQKLTEAAQAMGDAAKQLDNVKNYSGYVSGAVKGVSEKVDDLADMVRKAQTRYDGAGSALTTYADELADAQAAAAAAISHHDAATGALSSAVQHENDTRLNPFDLTTTPQDVTDHDQAVKAVKHLQDQADAASAAYHAAVDQRDKAANTATNAIHDANDASDLNDHWWQHLQFWDHLDWKNLLATLKTIADVVAIISTIVGVILLFTPFAPLAAVAFAISRVASLVSLGIQLVQLARGETTLWAVGLSVLFLCTGGLSKLGKGLFGGLRGTKLLPAVAGKLRSALPAAGKNLGKIKGDLQVGTNYRNLKSLLDDGKKLRNFENMGKEFQQRHELLGLKRQMIASAAEKQLRDKINSKVTDLAVNKPLDNWAKSLGDGKPGANVQFGPKVDIGVSSDGTYLNLPNIGGLDDVQISQFGQR
ncbi:hypothetical protein SAMN04487968_112120 [Nocardioides terrae]|uniref:Putative T7SS secretion signal domain-containing protein n=1 Tax=Nocardioides terrae TaxID=574651 RepID=A0A1I1MPV7_9ACTN|nr:hypothetical protein [Nocardioides terrae]SFC85218.1 hypothetical protein SAMN04487968_112120 [Nocardioides terrae]